MFREHDQYPIRVVIKARWLAEEYMAANDKVFGVRIVAHDNMV